MKNLNLIFNLLLFPFLFLFKMSSNSMYDTHSHRRRCEREKSSVITFYSLLSALMIVSTLSTPLFAADECGGYRDTATLNSSNTSYDREQNIGDWNVGPNADSMTRNFYFNVTEPGTVTIELYNVDLNQADFSYSDNSCPPASGGSKSQTVVFDAAGDFNIKVYYLAGGNTNIEYGLRVTWSPPLPPQQTCPGIVIPNLDGTSVTANQVVNGTVPGDSLVYYHFTPAVAGTVQVDSFMSDGSTYNSLFIRDVTSGCPGSDLWSDTGNSNTKSSPEVSVSAGQTIVIAYERRYSSDRDFALDITYTVPVAPTMGDILDRTILAYSPFTYPISGFVTDTGGSPVTSYTLTGTLPAGVNFNSSTGILGGTPTETGVFNLSVSATNVIGTSNSDDFILTVNMPPVDAVDDSLYTTPPGVDLVVDAAHGVLSNDSGGLITVTSNTQPGNGTVSVNTDGSFTYSPDSGFQGTDTFSYTITDANNQTDSAEVTINVREETAFHQGYHDFEKVNPPETYNVPGDFTMAGNTVMCLTGNAGTFGGSCSNSSNNNNSMGRYIDIDGTSGIGTKTFNSSSSNIILPPQARKVLWAGLFWQGNINGEDWRSQRLGVQSGSSWSYENNIPAGGTGINLDYETNGASDVLVKVGSDSDYTAVSAHTLYHVPNASYGANNAGEYASYAVVTDLFSNYMNLSSVVDTSITVTVANISTNEGRTETDGVFGGWSLAVIYEADPDHQDTLSKNISIYNGYGRLQVNQAIEEPTISTTISGFRLPSGTDPVNAQFGVFAGEGESVYQPDTLSIDHGTGDQQVGSSNVFDSAVSGIVRDTTHPDNVMTNLDSLDIDLYDVSDIMTSADRSISELDLYLTTGQDTIFPSMFAFSVELYVPELCYDYTLDINGHIIESINNQIKTPFGGFGKPLTSHLYVRSTEGDLDLVDVYVSYRIDDTSQLTYIPNSTMISETGKYTYEDAADLTNNESDAGFDMNIGTGASSNSGGTIGPDEDRYIKLDSKFETDKVNTSFTFAVNYKVDYGSGGVPYRQNFIAEDLCPAVSGGFLPELGFFNVVDGGADHNIYNLYTQVSKRPFYLTVYAYDADTPTDLYANDLNLSVEVEIIRADNFGRDADVACHDEHSLLSEDSVKFAYFDNSKSADVSFEADDLNLAYRSAAMRVWYLTDVDGNGTLSVDHNCTRDNQSGCHTLYERDYNSNTVCSAECAQNGSGCYDCLRSAYGRMVCSRDNFAIRPESFVTKIIDSNQSEDIDKPSIDIANSIYPSTPFSVIAGYKYRFDINATNHVDNKATPRYIQHFEPGSATHRAQMEWYPNGHIVSNCNDFEDKNISINLFYGSSVNDYNRTSYVDKVEQIGEYRFEIFDSNWTSADWDPAQMSHHYEGDYTSNYLQAPDCANGSAVLAIDAAGKNGCEIRSVHTNVDTEAEYDYLYAQYYPYTFNVSGLNIGAGPGNANSFVYINTLNRTLYPNGVDENMSYNIRDRFYAAGYTGTIVNNFVDNCYSDDVDMTLQHTYLSDIPSNTPDLTADLIDYNTTNPSLTYPNNDPADRRRIPFSNTLTKNVITGLTITQNSDLFVKDMQGAITMDLGFNFDRDYSTTLNPRKINFSDFNITYNAATLPSTIYVDLIDDYKIFGNRHIDQNVTFLYGRAKPALTYYETINNNINTPVSVVVYCNLGYTECQNRGIMALVAQTNEANWWKSWNHNNNPIVGGMDGTIELVSAPTSALNTTTVSITSEGEDPTINVNNGGVVPLLVPVNLVVDDPTTAAPADYTDRWLIYNEYDANNPPIPFYRVKFLGNSGWVGKGDTGHVVGDDVNTKNNRRLEW